MLCWKVEKEKDAASLTSTQNCIKGLVFAWILWNRSLHSCEKTKALSLPGSFGTGHCTAVKRQRPCLCLDPLEQVTAQLWKDKGLVFAWILWNRSLHSCEKTKALSLPGSFGTGHCTAVKRQRPCLCLDPLEQVTAQLWKDKGLVFAWILWNRSLHSCEKTKALSLPGSFGTGHCTAMKRQRPCLCLDPLEQVITQLWKDKGLVFAWILWNRSLHSHEKTKALSLPGSFGTGHCTAMKRQRPCLCLDPLEQVITQLWKDKGLVLAWILWNRSSHSCEKTKALSLPGSFGTGHHTAVKRQRPCPCLDPLEQVITQLWKDKGLVLACILWNRSSHSCEKTKALSLPGSFGTGHHTAVKRQRPCPCLDPLEQVITQLWKDKGLVFACILWNRSSHSCEKTKALSLPGSFGTGHHTAVKRQRPCLCLDPLEQVITQLWKDKGLVLAWILWNRSLHSCEKTKALSLPGSFGTGHCTAVILWNRSTHSCDPLEQVITQLWSFGTGHHTAVILWNRSSHSCDPLEQVITQLWSFGTGHHTAVILWNRSSHSCDPLEQVTAQLWSFGTGHCTAVILWNRSSHSCDPLEQVTAQLWKDKQTSHAQSPDTAVNYHWSPGYIICVTVCAEGKTQMCHPHQLYKQSKQQMSVLLLCKIYSKELKPQITSCLFLQLSDAVYTDWNHVQVIWSKSFHCFSTAKIKLK